MKGKRWLWIGGWGLPASWLREILQRRLPKDDHVVIPPVRDWQTLVRAASFDRLGGYSLGARLLLRTSETDPSLTGDRAPVLLAPFLPPAQEDGEKGKRQETGFRKIGKMLARDPSRALALFHKVAGLPLTTPQLPYPHEDLEWGLHFLAKTPLPESLPSSWSIWMGGRDPLLDAPSLAVRYPSAQVVPDASHDADSLLMILLNEDRFPLQGS